MCRCIEICIEAAAGQWAVARRAVLREGMPMCGVLERRAAEKVAGGRWKAQWQTGRKRQLLGGCDSQVVKGEVRRWTSA